MDKNLLVTGLTAFATTSILLWLLEPVARHIGLVDRPGGRKTHSNPTPLIGGIAMSLGFAFSILWLDVPLSEYRLLFGGALVLLVVGVLDDLHELSARMRFGAQIVAGLIMTLGAHVILHDFGYLLWPEHLVSLGIVSIPLTVFAAVGVINAVNMSDGVDGLAASMVLVAVCALGLLAWSDGHTAGVAVLILLAGVLVAFLTFNLRLHGPALAFMGDAGSMFLGFVLTWFLVQFSQGSDRLLAPVTALWVFALPLIDTVSMMLRRVLRRRSPFLADREHFHHILLAAGLGPKQTLSVMILLATAAASAGLAGHLLGIAERWMFLGFVGLFLLHFSIVMNAWKVKRFLKHPLVPKTEVQN